MAFVPAIIAAVGAVASVASSIKQGRDAKKAAKRNAANVEDEAAVERDQALRDEEALRRDTSSIQGRSRAALAEAGLSNTGSTARLIQQGEIDAELDALNIRYTGQLASRGLLSQAQEFRRQGKLAVQNSRILAGQALLAGAGRVTSAYGSLNRG
jgi:hypothetical protein